MITMPERLKALCARLGWPSAGQPLWDIVHALYQIPARHYHSLEHIEDCLQVLDQVADAAEDRDVLELALWMHDCVYDPRARDNEERSAEISRIAAAALGLSAHRAKKVSDLILATKHTGDALAGDFALIVDVDLSSLGAPWQRGRELACAIRREYMWVPAAEFQKGRTAILQGLAARPSIYNTAWFRQRYESPARENIARQIEALGRGELLDV